MSKKLERSGEGVSEKGEEVGLPHPLPLILIFRNISQFSSSWRMFAKRKGNGCAQATCRRKSKQNLLRLNYGGKIVLKLLTVG